jgi:hypothetical protein
MFVAERPGGSKGRKMSEFTEQRFCLFRKLRKEFFSTTYATDCMKTYSDLKIKNKKEDRFS